MSVFTVSTTSFVDPEQVAGRYEEAKGVIMPLLTELIEARAEVMAQIVDNENRIEELGAKQAKLLADAEDLKDEAVKLAQTGGNPLKVNAKRRAKEGEAADILTWIADLKEYVKALVIQGNEAEGRLFAAWKVAENEYWQEVQAKFNNMHRALSEYHSAYLPGMEKVYAEVMQPATYLRFAMTHMQRQGQRSITRLAMEASSSVYGIQERHGFRLLGTVLSERN